MTFNASELYRESLLAQKCKNLAAQPLNAHNTAILAAIDGMYAQLSKQIHALKTEGQDE